MSPNPFEIFNLVPSFNLKLDTLEKTYYELSKENHPDRFARDTTNRPHSLKKIAEINDAYSILKNKSTRLDALLDFSGIKPNNQQNIPIDLSEEYFELQEKCMDDPTHAPSLATSFRNKLIQLLSAETETLYRFAEMLDWSQVNHDNLKEIVNRKNKISYINSLITNTDQLILRLSDSHE